MEQIEFDFSSGTDDGYERWRRDERDRIRAISNEWSVPLNKIVRLKLRNMPKEMCGSLTLLEHPRKIKRKTGPLKLRLNLNAVDFELNAPRGNHIEFSSDEIKEWHIEK
ncbi:MAG: hypothetical protein KAG97_02465 [Victivallales bacterium]|nr:hypothetical protein [Victivallales bacterium]